MSAPDQENHVCAEFKPNNLEMDSSCLSHQDSHVSSYISNQSDSSSSTSEHKELCFKVRTIANEIFREFERLVNVYDNKFLETLTPLVVTALESLNVVYIERDKYYEKYSLLSQDHAQLLREYERERSMRKTADLKLLSLEDHLEGEKREFHLKFSLYESRINMLEGKVHVLSEQIQRLEEKENELVSTHREVEEQYNALVRTYTDSRRQFTKYSGDEDEEVECPSQMEGRGNNRFPQFLDFGQFKTSFMSLPEPSFDELSQTDLNCDGENQDGKSVGSSYSSLQASNPTTSESLGGGFFSGVTHEVKNLVKENQELLQTKDALNIVISDLIGRIDELTFDCELLSRERRSLIGNSASMLSRIRSLEDEKHRSRTTGSDCPTLRDSLYSSGTCVCVGGVDGAGVDSLRSSGPFLNEEQMSDNTTLWAQKRFSLREMTRAIFERNAYKQELLELRDALFLTELLRAERAAASRKPRGSTARRNWFWRRFSRFFAKPPKSAPIDVDSSATQQLDVGEDVVETLASADCFSVGQEALLSCLDSREDDNGAVISPQPQPPPSNNHFSDWTPVRRSAFGRYGSTASEATRSNRPVFLGTSSLTDVIRVSTTTTTTTIPEMSEPLLSTSAKEEDGCPTLVWLYWPAIDVTLDGQVNRGLNHAMALLDLSRPPDESACLARFIVPPSPCGPSRVSCLAVAPGSSATVDQHFRICSAFWDELPIQLSRTQSPSTSASDSSYKCTEHCPLYRLERRRFKVIREDTDLNRQLHCQSSTLIHQTPPLVPSAPAGPTRPQTTASLPFSCPSTLWLGGHDGGLTVYSLRTGGDQQQRAAITDTLQLPGPVAVCRHFQGHMFVGLVNRQLLIFRRQLPHSHSTEEGWTGSPVGDSPWELTEACVLSEVEGLSKASHSSIVLLGVSPANRQATMWVAFGATLVVLAVGNTLDVMNRLTLSVPPDRVTCMTGHLEGVWVGMHPTPVVKLYHVASQLLLQSVDISFLFLVNEFFAPPPSSLSSSSSEVTRTTSKRCCAPSCLLATEGHLWVGTSVGDLVILPTGRCESTAGNAPGPFAPVDCREVQISRHKTSGPILHLIEIPQARRTSTPNRDAPTIASPFLPIAADSHCVVCLGQGEFVSAQSSTDAGSGGGSGLHKLSWRWDRDAATP